MNEAQTRRDKIDPKLSKVGWGVEEGSKILVEQSAYIAPGRITSNGNKNPKKADYILEYKGIKLAVIEAKSDEKNVAEGVEQAKLYANALKIRFSYSTNGDKIWFIDMGVKDSKGEYTAKSTEGFITNFPSPQELWQMTFPEENGLRDKFNACAFSLSENRKPRYYQEIAINNVLSAVAKQQKRILLTMATGTGKTYTAFQICWKLTKAKWNTENKNREPKILFIADRNILANQAINDFNKFDDNAMCRITPQELKRNNYQVPTARNLYFTIFQTMMTSPNAQITEEQGNKVAGDNNNEPYYKHYDPNFFDFIIIDECHRGGANDESEWRQLMEYFESAYQLGMTATPKRNDNANTYKYFGEPVYTYSLKQGIEDGFLVPYRVEKSTSNIDNYQFEEGDTIINGDIDEERTYTENDFHNRRIEIRERDELRVKELLNKINTNDKTIIFCSTQIHAMIIRDMVNIHKKSKANNYCERVTADDGEDGETKLRAFQDNEQLLPTILTTSHKLSTGVDARNVRNIVLMRPINNMVEFKQIIGRGTRLFDGKYYFTIYDFVGASDNFNDPEWDGEPVCSKCGNWPCSCKKQQPQPCKKCGNQPCSCEKPQPQPCKKCGNLPCTCEGPKTQTIVVELSEERRLSLETNWQQMISFGDELITPEEYIKKLFGAMPNFFKKASDLREQWANPETREKLLNTLAEAGFAEDKLNILKDMLKLQKCDLLDVLEYIAYSSTPIERAKRVEIVKQQYVNKLNEEQQKFDNLILHYYVNNGFNELNTNNLSRFINIHFNSIEDAKQQLNMETNEIRNHYFELQQQLYNTKQIHR